VAVAYLATGASFPDALAGGAAAAKAGGPVLLTTQSSLPAATASELSRLKPGRIVVLGGSGVIADGLLATLRGYTAGSVTRLAGADRYATAAAISDSYPADGPSTVYLATGTTFPDGLAAAPVAGRGGAPLLLTSPTSLPPVVADALRRLNPSRVVVLGSSGAVGDAVLAAVRSLWD
jgi:putative cell wall-binding protein